MQKKRTTTAHYNAILLEEIRSQMQLVIETVEGSEARLIQRMDERFERVDGELHLLKSMWAESALDLMAWNKKSNTTI